MIASFILLGIAQSFNLDVLTTGGGPNSNSCKDGTTLFLAAALLCDSTCEEADRIGSIAGLGEKSCIIGARVGGDRCPSVVRGDSRREVGWVLLSPEEEREVASGGGLR